MIEQILLMLLMATVYAMLFYTIVVVILGVSFVITSMVWHVIRKVRHEPQ